MGGKPNWFQVMNLEVVAAGGASGDEMMDVIEIRDPAVGQGDAFRLIVTFEGNPNGPLLNGFWLEGAEAQSDNSGTAIPATAQFWAETIGPGDEVVMGAATVDLTAGGDPGNHPSANASLYQAQLDIADANTVFVDNAGAVQPAVYLIGCAVHFQWDLFGLTYHADAYYQQELLVRVALR